MAFLFGAGGGGGVGGGAGITVNEESRSERSDTGAEGLEASDRDDVREPSEKVSGCHLRTIIGPQTNTDRKKMFRAVWGGTNGTGLKARYFFIDTQVLFVA